MSEAIFDARATALLILDMQEVIVEMINDPSALLSNTASAIAAARNAGLPVIYIVVGFRPGFPEINPRNKAFSTIRASGRFNPSNTNLAIHVAVAPQKDDVVVTKHRMGAFFATDLDMILRAQGVDTIALAGISTSGVILSTLRYATDADYRVIVLEDACADADAEVHRLLMEKIFPRHADVITTSAFAYNAGTGSSPPTSNSSR